MGTYDRYKRSGLFLVRVWTRTGKGGGEGHEVKWRGKVQSVMDGESHQFSSLQELTELLQTMLANNEGR